MTELQDVQNAGAKVLNDSLAAYQRGEISDAVALGIRLLVVSLIMKPAHRPPALKIAREYTEAVGIDFDALEEQMSARIYEQVQLSRLGDTKGEGS